MAKLAIKFDSCVHSRSILAECRKCQDSCEDDAIFVVENSIHFYDSKCSECLACVSVCPSMAISPTNADIFGFVHRFLDTDSTVIDSSIGFSPLGFEEQTLLTLLALKKTPLVMMLDDDKMAEKISTKVIKINSYAKAFGMNEISLSTANMSQSKSAHSGSPSDRRAFFRAFSSKNIISVARDINQKSQENDEPKVYNFEMIDYSDIKVKKLPFVREPFLAILGNITMVSGVEPAPLFSTDKFVDESCTNCELCYNLCPTGALSTTRLKNAINFESYKCIKCALCEDVCDTKSIHSLPSFDLSNFAKKGSRTLIKFKVARCASCSGVFSPMRDDEYVCPRCAKEDEDALELSGLF